MAALTACAEAGALDPYVVAANGFRGVLALQREPTPDALDAIGQSLTGLRAARYELLVTPFTVLLAQGLEHLSCWQEARALIEAAIPRCEASGEMFAMPELLRIRAKIAYRQDGDIAASKALLREAIDLAHEQGTHV